MKSYVDTELGKLAKHIEPEEEQQNKLEDLVKQDLQAINLLRNGSDDEFREKIEPLMNSAPSSVQTVNAFYEEEKHISQDNRENKFDHIKRTLRLLDTSELAAESVFITRAGMMFHDCNPGDVIEDLCRWVAIEEMTPQEAVAVMRQVWWHDLLGVDINKNGGFTDFLTEVIKDREEREINLAIFKADVSSYGFLKTYTEILEKAEKLKDFQREPVSIEAMREANPSLKDPDDEDIFMHGIFSHDGSSKTKQITPAILMGLLTSGLVKSTGNISDLEAMKTKGSLMLSKATDGELNVFRFQPDNFPEEISAFGQEDNNWLTLVFFGKDIKNKCLVKPLEVAEDIDYVAGLVNRVNTKEKPSGCELSIDDAYFLIEAEAAQTLIPLLKLQALKVGVDPDEWVNQRVVFRNKEIEDKDLLSALQAGKLDLKEHNVRALIKDLNYDRVKESRSVLSENFDSVEGEDLNCKMISFENLPLGLLVSELANCLKTFPWLVKNPQLKDLLRQIIADKQEENEILNKVYHGEKDGVYFNPGKDVLYLSGQNHGIVVIENVQSYELSNYVPPKYALSWEGDLKITLNNGKTIKIKKSSFSMD